MAFGSRFCVLRNNCPYELNSGYGILYPQCYDNLYGSLFSGLGYMSHYGGLYHSYSNQGLLGFYTACCLDNFYFGLGVDSFNKKTSCASCRGLSVHSLCPSKSVITVPVEDDDTVITVPVEDTAVITVPVEDDDTVITVPVEDTAVITVPVEDDDTVITVPVEDTAVITVPVEDDDASSTVITIPVEDTTVITVPVEDDDTVITVPVEDTAVITVPIEDDDASSTVITIPVEDTKVITVPVEDTTVITVPVEDDDTVITVPVEDTTVITIPVEDTTVITVPVEDTTVITVPVEDDDTVITIPVEDTDASSSLNPISNSVPIPSLTPEAEYFSSIVLKKATAALSALMELQPERAVQRSASLASSALSAMTDQHEAAVEQSGVDSILGEPKTEQPEIISISQSQVAVRPDVRVITAENYKTVEEGKDEAIRHEDGPARLQPHKSYPVHPDNVNLDEGWEIIDA